MGYHIGIIFGVLGIILEVLGMILWVLGMIFGVPFKYLEYTRYNFRGTMYNIGDTGYVFRTIINYIRKPH